ncbi:siderophore-interacting protein [Actinocrispum sp. NPDC049592]|uniref:siderophore-interacting protein n=1 Tax=Actinocrispum sp. NPDC049592 TaxID=3154835 RepID=UPI00341F01ED
MPTASKVILAEVRGVRRLTPHMSRITLHLDGLSGFDHTGPDQLVRTFFPQSHQRVPVVPLSDDWWTEYQQLPEDIRPVVRNYTIRRFLPARRSIDLDFVLHGDTGPASRWAQAAQPGDVIGVLTDGHGYNEPEGTTSRLLIADETALPAAGAILDAQDGSARLLAEVNGAQDEIPLKASVRWIHRDGPARGTGELMVSHLSSVPIEPAGLYVWIGGEAGMVKAARRHLVARGVPKKQIYFCGYWLHKRNDNDAFLEAERAEYFAQLA